MDPANERADDQISMECEISCPELEADSMSLAEVVSAIDASESDVYEPEKVCALDAPPKRFYRRSWRSVVQRLLEFQRAAVLALKKPTASSDA